MHAKYLSPQFAARGETGLRNPEHQQNFFTHPQTVTSSPKHRVTSHRPSAFARQGMAGPYRAPAGRVRVRSD